MNTRLSTTALATALLSASCAMTAGSGPGPGGTPAAPAPAAVSTSTTAPAASTSARPTATEAVRISLSESDFRESGMPHQTRDVVLPMGRPLVLRLGANPTTGYRWNAEAGIDPPAVLRQTGHGFDAPPVPIPGAGGIEQWTFQGLQPGVATVRLAYARSWAPQEAGWTLTLRVTVR